MEQDLPFMNSELFNLIFPVIILFAVLVFGYIIRKILFTYLIRWSKNSKTQLDGIVAHSIKAPFMVWFLMFGLYLAIEYSKIPSSLVYIINKILVILAIFSVAHALANVAANLIKTYSSKIKSALPVTSLTQNLSRIIIFGIGLLGDSRTVSHKNSAL